MAVEMDKIRVVANRVAASHGLEIVEIDFEGAGKARSLRVFLEKDAKGREALKERALQPDADLPSGVPVEALSGVTHEDCAAFATDFGTVIDIEELIPGAAEYTLEVSSPGIERKLIRAADYQRFTGFVATVKLFTAIDSVKTFTGRMTFANDIVTLDLAAIKQKGRRTKAAAAAAEIITIPLRDIEKANLVAEI